VRSGIHERLHEESSGGVDFIAIRDLRRGYSMAKGITVTPGGLFCNVSGAPPPIGNIPH
jgi:hypothetical protein